MVMLLQNLRCLNIPYCTLYGDSRTYVVSSVIVKLFAASEAVDEFFNQEDEEEAADQANLSHGLLLKVLILVEGFANLIKSPT